MKVGIKEKILKLDANLTERIRLAERPAPLRRIAILFAHSGDSWFWLLGLGLLWLLGDERGKATALTMALGILITAAIVFVLKFTIRRQRPEGDWGGIYRKTDPHSFPSGHAARAVMLAVIAVGLGPAWLAVLLVIWAPLVILARVAMGVHYLSDVLAGALVGAVTGWLALQLYPFLAAL
jgi:undecaprenyl-diphosphatase